MRLIALLFCPFAFTTGAFVFSGVLQPMATALDVSAADLAPRHRRHAASLGHRTGAGTVRLQRHAERLPCLFPRRAPPYAERRQTLPPVKVTVLAIHGLNDLREWVDGDLTIKAWPGVGHFVQQDAPERLTSALTGWLPAWRAEHPDGTARP